VVEGDAHARLVAALGGQDQDLARRLEGIVPTATIETLGTVAQPRR
jgi:hypothetical protein